MDVYWLEQRTADVPSQDDWLSANEIACLGGMRFAKRRGDWRLGRWTAKCAATAHLKLQVGFEDIEVRPALSGAPEVFIAGEAADVTISLSHCDGTAMCAIANSGVALGCDLEAVEARSDAFITDYFTAEERELVARADASERFRVLALLWSAKESALKALRVGLRLDTRSVVVRLDGDVGGTSVRDGKRRELNIWHSLHVCYGTEQVFQGWWGQSGDRLVRTMVGFPTPLRPLILKVECEETAMKDM